MLCDIQDDEGEMESICIGGGEIVPGKEEPSTLARLRKSCARESPTEKELEERADDGNSSNDVVPVRSEDVEVMRLIPKRLGRFRKTDGPGSLSTVAKEMADIRPKLGASEDDIEWSSSNSLRRALDCRSSLRQVLDCNEPSNRPAAALTVVEETPLAHWP